MHFLSKLHNNFILTGSVDCYCLVCDNYLRSEDEAFTHIEKPIHKKNMGMAVRVEKFFADQIIKVKKGYYCPLCNVLLLTTIKVSFHIGDPYHLENRKAQMLSRIGDRIIAFNEVVISLEAWHSVMENTCLICNTEFEENEMHQTDHSHVLKLIQSKCEFGDKYVYRKVDEDSFFCLICGTVHSLTEKPNHHKNSTHENRYTSGKELRMKIEKEQLVLPKQYIDTVKNKQTVIEKTVVEVNKTNRTEKVDTKKAEKETLKSDIEVKCTKGPNKESVNNLTQIKNFKQDVASQIQNNLSKQENADKISLVCKMPDEDKIIEKINIKNSEKGAKGANEKTEKKAPFDANAVKEVKQKPSMLDRIEEFQKKSIHIDLTSEKARCKRCNESLLFDPTAVEKHIEEKHGVQTKIYLNKNPENCDEKHLKKMGNSNENSLKQLDNPNQKPRKRLDNNSAEKSSKQLVSLTEKPPNKLDKSSEKLPKKIDNCADKCPKKPEIPNEKTFENSNEKLKISDNNEGKPDPKKNIKQNYMIPMPDQMFCPLCNVRMPYIEEAIEAHLNTATHKEKIYLENESELAKKVPLLEYLETVVQVELVDLIVYIGSPIILNDKYLLRLNSFHCCIIMEDDSYTCFICDKDLLKAGDQLSQHMNGPDHKHKLSLCKVVTSIPEEFIREILTHVYHCGFCNTIVYGWIALKDHLSTQFHIDHNRHAAWSLERSRSVTRNARLVPVSTMVGII